jgi:hypothetical protein
MFLKVCKRKPKLPYIVIKPLEWFTMNDPLFGFGFYYMNKTNKELYLVVVTN